ncbi:hypothetical protein [Actinomadura sp. 9N407]|uniref:hypothetical protein n=1 Tax=Actinomadura sp. 9N407 TaxID=3375154 RepID=UPI0037AE3591
MRGDRPQLRHRQTGRTHHPDRIMRPRPDRQRLSLFASWLDDRYEHVTPQMRQRLLAAPQARWEDSVRRLTAEERRWLCLVVPAELAAGVAQGDGPGDR